MKKTLPKLTASRIKALKGTRRISCLTAYDYSTARIMDASGIDLILVGDSLAMTVLGYDTTLPVTMDEMVHHTSAVVRGVKSALVVADMPFMSYQVSNEQALENAGRLIKEAGADAVKIEGGAIRVQLVRSLVQNGIPVLGHIGLTPQSIREMGGYKVQGRNSEGAQILLNDAQQLAKAGVFAIVLECMPTELGAAITKAVCVPTIGIGAGRHCDGQILVSHDMLGMYSDLAPRFVKKYASLGDAMLKAFAEYRTDVEKNRFPDAKHSY